MSGTAEAIFEEVRKLAPEPYDLLIISYRGEVSSSVHWAVKWLSERYPACRVLAVPDCISIDHMSRKQVEELTRHWPE